MIELMLICLGCTLMKQRQLPEDILDQDHTFRYVIDIFMPHIDEIHDAMNDGIILI